MGRLAAGASDPGARAEKPSSETPGARLGESAAEASGARLGRPAAEASSARLGRSAAEASAPKDLTLWSYSRDTTAPTANLSDSLKNKQEEGLTVGVNYTVSTSLTIEDCSSTTTTYVVYKQVGSDNGGDSDGWLQIYDSATREVAEGYENNISTGGVITPLESDVTGEYVYKIVYTVKDAYNFESVTDADKPAAFKPTLLLKVKPAEAEEKSPVDVWKIILYVIAGLSAVGIVVLLFVKPKQATDDGRYNASAANNSDNSDSSDVK